MMGSETRTGADDCAELSEFLLHISHDLRTALRAIRLHADLLLKSHPGPQAPGSLEERLGFIVGGARKLDSLAEGIASYSIALEIQEGTFLAAPMDVLLRRVLAKLDKELRANDACVTHHKLPRVRGDADRLIEVFENLIRNSLHHRGIAPPLIQITVEKQADHWLFAVRDSGPGVPPAYLENIFRPFTHLGANRHGGPGLGLTICRAIVERHGGRIWVESTAETMEGGGAEFRFTLPAT